MNPSYGNVSKIVRNETHFGEVTLFYFKRIETFIKITSIVSENGKVLTNLTQKPCDQKNAVKIDSLLKKIMEFSPTGKNALTGPPKPVKCHSDPVSLCLRIFYFVCEVK